MSTKSRNSANKQRYKYDDDYEDDRKRGKKKDPEIRRPTRNWKRAWLDYESKKVEDEIMD